MSNTSRVKRVLDKPKPVPTVRHCGTVIKQGIGYVRLPLQTVGRHRGSRPGRRAVCFSGQALVVITTDCCSGCRDTIKLRSHFCILDSDGEAEACFAKMTSVVPIVLYQNGAVQCQYPNVLTMILVCARRCGVARKHGYGMNFAALPSLPVEERSSGPSCVVHRWSTVGRPVGQWEFRNVACALSPPEACSLLCARCI